MSEKEKFDYENFKRRHRKERRREIATFQISA